jgi:hypothetical protein
VAVGHPAVGAVDAGDKVRVARRGGRPQPEGAVDMGPGARGPRDRDDVGERIEGARIHVSRLQAEDGAIVERRQAVGADPALRIGFDQLDPLAAEAEDGERLEQGGMALRADDDAQARRPEQAVLLDVVAGAKQEMSPCRGEADEIADAGAGNERRDRFGRQAEDSRSSSGRLPPRSAWWRARQWPAPGA